MERDKQGFAQVPHASAYLYENGDSLKYKEAKHLGIGKFEIFSAIA